MPGIIEFTLDVPDAVQPYPARLHGAACALLELPTTDHHAQQKPFAVWPMLAEGDGARWRLGWLPERHPPLRRADSVRFGPARCGVRDRNVALVGFACLAAADPATRAELRMVSPTYFSRNGRDHPLPDPVLIVDSTVRRWNAHTSTDLQIPDPEHRALRAAVVLADFRGGTEHRAVSYTMDQVGFVGTVTLALPPSAERSTRHLFAALMRFAEVAGVGAQTTHGFGAVELLTLDRRTAPG